MAQDGWAFTRVTMWGTYCFEKSVPEKSNYRIDYRHFKNNSDFNEYIQLFHDAGWLHIAGSKNNGNQYFKQMNSSSDTDIFSDAASRAGRYKRASFMMLPFALVFALFVIVALQQGTLRLDVFTNPRELWLTPGLWEREAPEFWFGFLFEMPFALARGFSWCFSLIFVFAYAVLTIKSWLLYRKTLKLGNV